MPVWPLERLIQYRAKLAAAESADGLYTEKRTNPIENLLERTVVSARDFARGGPESRKGRDVWVLSASNYRRKDAFGEYQCIFAEHLRKELGSRLLFIERNHAALPLQERDDVLFIDAALIAAEGAGRLLAPLVLRTPLGADARKPGSPASGSLLCRDGVYARLVYGLARAWIRRARPRAVFVLNGYHLFIPFQIAVREANIPLIELQHGVIHESHPGYVFDGAPEWGHLPDHLVVFGRQFGELLERESPRWTGRWSVGGHPWLKEKRRGLENLPDSAFDTVVVFSQSIPPVRERLRALVPELREKLDRNVRLVLKPHPHEIDAAEYYAEAARRGVEIASPREDAYQLLRRCRLSVTVFSTVAIEALAFRCRSVVLRAGLWPEDVRVLVDQGALQAASDATDVARLGALGPAQGSDEGLANRFFGVLEPELDFEQLIEDVRSRRRRP